MSKQECPN